MAPSNGMDSALLFSPDSMVRVYLFVERDYMLDIVSMISARVSCSRFKGDPLKVSHVIGSLPRRPKRMPGRRKKAAGNILPKT